VKHLFFPSKQLVLILGRVTVIALSDVQGEVTIAILRLECLKKLEDVFYVIEVEPN
jgi:hypothetical protein